MADLPFGFDKAEESPGFLLWQTTMLWQRKIREVLEPYGISHAQFVILATLLWFSAHGEETTQIRIASWSRLDKMTVSKALKKLAGHDFVNRIEHGKDSRAKSVSLTKKGSSLVKKLAPLVEAVDEQFFGRVASKDQKRVIQILSTLAR